MNKPQMKYTVVFTLRLVPRSWDAPVLIHSDCGAGLVHFGGHWCSHVPSCLIVFANYNAELFRIIPLLLQAMHTPSYLG